MIVSALVQRYKDKPGAPVGWQRRDASYALNIDCDGKLLDVVPLEHIEEKLVGKKTRKFIIRRIFTLPLEFSRQGPKAYETVNFLCDNGEFMLGMTPEKFETAGKFHTLLLEDVDAPEARAIKAYFNQAAPGLSVGDLDKKTAEAVKFVFQVDGKFVDYENQLIRNAWDNYYDGDYNERYSKNETARCLITGEYEIQPAIHNTVGLRNGQSVGCRLISANSESFTSYGKTAKDRAADIGKFAAFAHVSALDDLLSSEKNRIFIGKDTLVYWAEEGGEAEEEAFGDWLSPPQADDAQALNDIMQRVAQGRMIHPERYNPARRFFLLCLSPAAARISVRFFHADSIGNIEACIVKHYKQMEIVSDNRTSFTLLPPWVILSETTVKQSASDASPLLGGQLLRSILTGERYPITLFHAMLTRIRAGNIVSQTKAAVIKAILLRNFTTNTNESEVITMSLNTESDNKPYVLGRLFAVLEKLQRDAAGGALNATIRDRYFANACANPGIVFPTLLRLSMHHSAKLDRPGFYERLKTELLGKLEVEKPFPAALSLEDQGRLIVGYYHQTQDLYTSKKPENKELNEAENAKETNDREEQ